MRLRTTTRTRRPIRPADRVAPPARPDSSATDAAVPRRARIGRRSALIAAIVLACVAGLATTLVLTMPRLERATAPTLTNDASPAIALDVAHPAGLEAGDVTVRVDGEAIDANRIDVSGDGERIEARIPQQADGDHRVVVTATGVGLLQQTLTSEWTMTVDTTAPAARVVAPVPATDGSNTYVPQGVAVVTRAPLRLTVAAEPGSTIDVTSSGRRADPTSAEPSDDPRRTLEVPLPQGEQVLTVTTTDPAGNETERSLRLLVDTIGPRVTARIPTVVRDNTLALAIAGHDAHGVELRVLLDGNELENAIQPVSTTPPPNAGATGDQPTGEEEPSAGSDTDGEDGEVAEPAPIAGRWRIVFDDGAFEGRHTLEVLATDSLGTTTRLTRRIIVDSGEELGQVEGLRAGARGRDVAQLHEALLEQGVTTRTKLGADLRTRSFGAPTRAAVQAFQSRRGMSADGIAGGDTVAALTLRIVIDRTSNTLTLYRMGAVVKTYGVATGSPQYPTPAGDFEIQSKQVDPTWTPPDSDWAKDAEPIPPGPDNPLGTRWMAINGTVGIHGTNNPASIGGSVSHGCIRMRIPDVEELFEMVEIGTPVTVV